MAIRWDDIEILRVLDECEQGKRSGIFSGFDLMNAIAVEHHERLTDEDYRSFVRELLAMANGGLITWTVMSSMGRVREISPSDPNDYLQNIRDVALTVPAGRDRSRNQMVKLPGTQSGEDHERSNKVDSGTQPGFLPDGEKQSTRGHADERHEPLSQARRRPDALHEDDDDPPSVPRPTSSGPRLLLPVLRWLNRDKIRLVDYIAAGILVAVISGLALFYLTRGSSSSSSNPNDTPNLKSNSTSGVQVFLRQGARKGDEYEYAITLSGFPAHASMSVSCRDGSHPRGFEFFEIATNRTGTASIAATPCYSPAGTDHWVVVDGIGSNHVRWTEQTHPVGGTFREVTEGPTNTWTNPQIAGGEQGPSIGSNAAVEIKCKVEGFRVADGNTWWYQVASSPWDNAYYASADAFYNNGSTSGSLKGTPFVDPRVPKC